MIQEFDGTLMAPARACRAAVPVAGQDAFGFGLDCIIAGVAATLD